MGWLTQTSSPWFLTVPLECVCYVFVMFQLVLEADGYQPYLLSPEKGLKSLIRRSLELAKDPAKSCVDEV